MNNILNHELDIGDTRKKLFWIALFRIFLLILLLFSTIVITNYIQIPVLNLARNTLLWGTFIALFPSCIYLLLSIFIKQNKILTGLIYFQFIQDTIFSAFIVIITGGTASGFTFMFPLVVIMASIFLFRTGAFIFATLSCGTLIAVGLMQTGVIEVSENILELIPFAEDTPAVAYSIFINMFAFYSIASLSSYMTEQARKSEILRTKITKEMENLKILHKHILLSIPVGIITLDIYGKILFINEAGGRILKINMAEIKNKDIVHLLPDLEPCLTKERAKIEIKIERSPDPPRILGFSIYPLLDHLQEKIGRLLVFQDVSDMKKMEEKMKHEERLAAIGKLASVIAHEMRNPLASISGSVQLMGSNEKLTDEDRYLFKIVHKEIEHLNRWIGDLLDYSKISYGAWMIFDLSALVREIVNIMSLQEDFISKKIIFSENRVFPIYGDQGRMRLAIMNLIRNGLEAIPDQGKVTVFLEKKELKGKNAVFLSIHDQGNGIQAENLSKVFEPFFTTKEKGTGLGLATVQITMEDHEGEVQVESSKEKGTKFTLKLPLSTGRYYIVVEDEKYKMRVKPELN